MPDYDDEDEDKWMWSTDGIIICKRKLKYSENNLPQYHFVHHKSHMGINCPSRLEDGN